MTYLFVSVLIMVSVWLLVGSIQFLYSFGKDIVGWFKDEQ